MNQTFQKLAADSVVKSMTPRGFSTIALVAAASILAAEMAGARRPTRQHFLAAIPAFLADLPDRLEDALQVTKSAATAALKSRSN